jgi:hypothetical protein
MLHAALKKGGRDLWRQVRKQFGKNDREWFFASSIENREREVDIVANVGLVVEFLKVILSQNEFMKSSILQNSN